MASRASIIKLYPNANFFYMYCLEDEMNAAQLASISASMDCPTWDTNTEFRINFDNALLAGNASFGDDPPTQYAIYRQEEGESSLKLVATIPGTRKEFTDYSVKNNHSYRYYIYPSSTAMIGSPFVTEYITYQKHYWELLVVNDTDTDNVYTLDSIYRFELNPEDITTQNNTEVNKIRTFSKYLRVQKDNVNCLTGTLSSLVGAFDCATNEYTEDIEMLDAIQTLSTDSRSKFLRDYAGHLYQIDISSPITFNQKVFSNGTLTSKQLEWTEIGSSELSQIVAAGDLDE